jgi:hypothetical protein
MKRNNIETGPLTGILRTLLCATLVTSSAVAATDSGRGGGGHGFEGRAFGGNGGFSGHQSVGREFSVNPGMSNGIVRVPAFAPQPAPQVARQTAPTITHEKGAQLRLRQRFDALSDRVARDGVATTDVKIRKERIIKTRDFLIGLEEIGWPVDLIDEWSDSLAQDEVVVGMPSDVVLDFWGNPLDIEPIIFAGAPADIWTFRRSPRREIKVTVSGNRVTAVRRV